MKQYSPLPPSFLDNYLIHNYNLCNGKKYILEKLVQLDQEILRSYSYNRLGSLFSTHRQTISVYIKEFIKENLILDTKIGFLITLPTATGYLGKLQSINNKFVNFSFTLINSDISYTVTINLDSINPDLLRTLVCGEIYFCESIIKENIKQDDLLKHIDFIGCDLKNIHTLSSIGYQLNDNNFQRINI